MFRAVSRIDEVTPASLSSGAACNSLSYLASTTYQYVNGDPLNFTDPLGLYWQPVCGAGTMGQGQYGPPLPCSSSTVQSVCSATGGDYCVSSNNVSYSSPYGPSEFNISAPGSGCSNLNPNALPGNLNAMNVWEWIPADLARLQPSSGTSGTSGVSNPNAGNPANNGWTTWAGAVLGCVAGGIAGAEAGSLIPGPGTAVGAVAGCVMGAGSADFGTPTWP